MKLSSLIEADALEFISVQKDLEIESICFDSRKVKKNSMFVAVNGTEIDGHRFIDDAIDSGAVAIVCEDIPSNPNSKVAWIKSSNSRKSLSFLLHRFYGNPEKNLKIVAVTGTNGKTTITFILKTIFEFAGYKCGLIGTTGTIIGSEFFPATHTTPDPIRIAEEFSKMKNENVDYVFMEVSSHALTQNRVEAIDFQAGIFTNLTHEHQDYHNTIEEYARAKQLLFNKLSKTSVAIINSDSPRGDIMVENFKGKIIRVGRNECDYKIIKERLFYDHTSFLINDEINVITPLIGRFNIDNIAQSFALASPFGIETNVILNAIENAYGAPGRMQRIKIQSGASAIIDYAHSSDALEKSLTTCREILYHSCGRLICVFGCGGDRDTSKRPIMGKIATDIADYIVITNDNPRTEIPELIINDILSGIPENKKEIYEIIEDRALAIARACELTNNGDILLVAGKGHEGYQIIGTEKLHFSDLEELQKFILND